MRYVELQGEMDKSDVRCDHEESKISDEEIVQCEEKLSIEEECDKAQGEIVEIARNENVQCDPECNVQCDPENMGESESIQGECQENKLKTNEKNVRCEKNVGEEKGQEVQCDHTENVRCD